MEQNASRIEGLWLPLVTPFKGGRLDDESLKRLIRHYADEPVDGLIVAATTGEGLTLSELEIEQLVNIAAAETEGGLPICLGLSGSDTHKLTRALESIRGWPVEGYLIACPYYSRPSQDGLFRHFSALAAHTDKPIVVYNIPYRTGVNLANDTLLRLAELPNIVGVKDCCADQAQSFELLRRRPLDFAVLTGEDALFYDALTLGADGGILATAHVETKSFAQIRRLMRQGDWQLARRSWAELIDVSRMLFAEPNPAPVKYWLWRAGLIDSPEVRLPMTSISDDLAARIDSEVQRRRRSKAETV